MKRKPIEPGCRAIVIGYCVNPKNMGRIVKALGKVGPGEMSSNGAHLYIDQTPAWECAGDPHPLSAAYMQRGKVLFRLSPTAFFDEAHLQRIDDIDDADTDSDTIPNSQLKETTT